MSLSVYEITISPWGEGSGREGRGAAERESASDSRVSLGGGGGRLRAEELAVRQKASETVL